MPELVWRIEEWLAAWRRVVAACEGVSFVHPKFDRFVHHIGLLDVAYEAGDQQAFRDILAKVEQAHMIYMVKPGEKEKGSKN